MPICQSGLFNAILIKIKGRANHYHQKFMDLTSQEKDVLVNLLQKAQKKMDKMAQKADKDGELHIVGAALKQKQELEVLLNKIL